MDITRTSILTNITRTLNLPVTQDQIDAWQAGELIQFACPALSPSQREFLMTGITDDEWDDTFQEG